MMESVADCIKSIRKSLKITQKELSKRSGISQAAISEIESGNKSPSASTLSMLAAGLGVPMADLVSDVSKTKKPIPEDELKESNAVMLSELDLSEQELQQVLAFVEGLKAARAVKDSPHK
jgi:transcriptional regulator with XRE-family HTH domain